MSINLHPNRIKIKIDRIELIDTSKLNFDNYLYHIFYGFQMEKAKKTKIAQIF